ncbi:MAG TPA: glycosyltransferase family A protein [Actinoplanes sp.]|nr:glycosyltransferase family A protein [Actinoplanes sp.]
MRSDLLDDYVRAIGPALRTALPATAIRHRSMDARRLMAHAALGDSGTLDELLTAARDGDRRWLARTRRRPQAGLFGGLAQIMALQDLLPTDRRDALALYELVRATYGPDALSPANQALHAQLTLAWDGPDRVPDLLAGYRRMSAAARAGLAVDLLNPFVAARPVEPWLAAFQALLPKPWPTLGGNADLAAFDRLTSPMPAHRMEAPERVSVVVTAYRPGEGLITAVRSVLAQSWRNVEIVIVDDGSPAEFDGMLQRALALGERIRLVRQPENRGTYAARSAGLDACGGEFVAFQDSDDWSHPRRLELQVAPMLADKRLVATTSDGLSVTDELLLTRPGVRNGRFNPSSLVFRRAAVTSRIGYFDPVRKAADSEYIGRMQAAFGARTVRHVETGPLALIRLSANSLSRAEIRAHWMHPARVAYSSAYLRWHQAIAAGEAAPYRPADGAGRPFAAPPHLLGAAADRSYDVVVVGDWRFQDGPVRAAIDEIRALAGAGLRVAVAHLESYRAVYRLRYPMCGPIQQLVNDRRIDHVSLSEAGTAHLVVIRQAEVLQFSAEGPGGIRARRVIVVADRAPDHRYAPATCAARVRQLFGVEPLWCPQDHGVRSALQATDPAAPLTREDLPPVVDTAGWVSTRAATTPGLPIVGADLGDGDAPPPELRDADVRVRLADRPPSDVDHGLPGSWLVYPAAEIGARPFLHQLDFYLHVPRPGTGELLSRAALEAAAAGCVVVLPERCAAVYGDAAVYAEPAGVPDLIHRYVADPELFAEQSRRARAVVAKAHHPRLFVDRMVGLIGPVTPPAPRNGDPGAGVTDVWPSGDLAPDPAR